MYLNWSPNPTNVLRRIRPRPCLATAKSVSNGRQYSSVLVTMARHVNIVDLRNCNNVDVEGTVASNCSGTFARTVLLFIFQKKALIVLNFDINISHVITHSHLARECFF